MIKHSLVRILITGGSGLLAMNWAIARRYEEEICLLTHLQAVNMPSVASKSVDLEDKNLIKKIIDEFDPKIIVHTAGLTNVDECEINPEKAKIANTLIACNLAEIAFKSKVKFVHISTDHLFSGKCSLLDENEIPFPINVYGKTKLDAEHGVTKNNPDALIIRTNFYGWGHKKRQSFSDWIINSLNKQTEIQVFDDIHYTPILIDELVSCIHKLISVQATGIVNVVGNERISKYDFAIAVANEFGLEKSLIKKGSVRDVLFKAQRPKDMSLSNQKQRLLTEYVPSDLSMALKQLKEQLDAGRPDLLNKYLITME